MKPQRLLPMSIYRNLDAKALELPKLTFGQTANARAVIEADKRRRAAAKRKG